MINYVDMGDGLWMCYVVAFSVAVEAQWIAFCNLCKDGFLRFVVLLFANRKELLSRISVVKVQTSWVVLATVNALIALSKLSKPLPHHTSLFSGFNLKAFSVNSLITLVVSTRNCWINRPLLVCKMMLLSICEKSFAVFKVVCSSAGCEFNRIFMGHMEIAL